MSADKMIHEEGLKYLDLFSLEKRKFRGELSAIFDYLMVGYREDLSGLCSQRARSSGHKLKEKSD